MLRHVPRPPRNFPHARPLRPRNMEEVAPCHCLSCKGNCHCLPCKGRWFACEPEGLRTGGVASPAASHRLWLPCQGELSAPPTEGSLPELLKETRPYRAMRCAPAPPPLGRGGKENSAASHRHWLPCQGELSAPLTEGSPPLPRGAVGSAD